MDRAHQRSEGDPKLLDKILTKVRSNLDVEGCSALNELLQNYNNEAAEIARRQPINLEAQKRLFRKASLSISNFIVVDGEPLSDTRCVEVPFLVNSVELYANEELLLEIKGK